MNRYIPLQYDEEVEEKYTQITERPVFLCGYSRTGIGV